MVSNFPTETLENSGKPSRERGGVQLHVKVYIVECKIMKLPVDGMVMCPKSFVHMVYVPILTIFPPFINRRMA